jgi:hypothetical protein
VIGQTHTGYQTDSNGNEHRELGSYTSTSTINGITSTNSYALEDVWFKQNTLLTSTTNTVSVSNAIAAMPDLQGYGNLYSLQQTMARDATGQLQALVTQYVGQGDAANDNAWKQTA